MKTVITLSQKDTEAILRHHVSKEFNLSDRFGIKIEWDGTSEDKYVTITQEGPSKVKSPFDVEEN